MLDLVREIVCWTLLANVAYFVLGIHVIVREAAVALVRGPFSWPWSAPALNGFTSLDIRGLRFDVRNGS